MIMSKKKRKQDIKACQRKRKYTKDQAYAMARRLNKKGRYLHAYKCPVCDGWHIGKPFRSVRVKWAFERVDRLPEIKKQ